jgi:FMN reductase
MSKNSRPENHVSVVGISGSRREGSYTRMAVDLALRGAREAGAQTLLIDLRKYDLAFCDGKQNENALPEDVFRLRREVSQASGIILGTPEYHGSFSGVLKNALDLMGFDEIAGKMIGLIGVSAGTFGGAHALESLRSIGRALHAWVIPEQAAIPEAFKVFDEAGNLRDQDLDKRVREVGRQVARFSFLHTSEKAQDFLRAWENAPTNAGG